MKTGLWKKQSQKGTNYYNGKIKIGEKEYTIRIFKSDKSKEKSPDLMLYLDEKEEEKKENLLDDKVFKDFGDSLENNITDEDLAF